MASGVNSVRVDVRERDKTLSCGETLTLGSTCLFSFYRDGAALDEAGYAVLRIPRGCFPGSPPGPYGLGAFRINEPTDVLKEPWLVNALRKLPVGTVTPLSMTLVTAEGVAAEGTVEVLVATVAEITIPRPDDPQERVAMFRGERGRSGVEVLEGDPVPEMDPQIKVAINAQATATTIREVPECPGDAKAPTTLADAYVLVALPDNKYAWAKLKAKVSLDLGSLPGRIGMIKDAEGSYMLGQTTMVWNRDAEMFEEKKEQLSATIPVIDHVSDHTDGVL